MQNYILKFNLEKNIVVMIRYDYQLNISIITLIILIFIFKALPKFSFFNCNNNNFYTICFYFI